MTNMVSNLYIYPYHREFLFPDMPCDEFDSFFSCCCCPFALFYSDIDCCSDYCIFSNACLTALEMGYA